MLGIHRNNDVKWYRWIRAWFEILDNLFGILTFNTYYMDLTGWWLLGWKDPIFGKCEPTSFTTRISWFIVTIVEIAEELVVILTLGYLVPDWVYYIWCGRM